MLTLKRKVGERIVLSGGIVLTILRVRGGTVSLGFDAPSSVDIDREEVFARKVVEGSVISSGPNSERGGPERA